MKVDVYVKSDCPQCTMTKRWLDRNNVRYQTISLEEDEKSLEMVKEKGFMSAPVVIVDNGNSWSGYNPTKLRELKEKE